MSALGVAGVVLFVGGFGLAMAINFWLSAAMWDKDDEAPRVVDVPGEDGKVAFSVEYRAIHPFLAEYDKAIVFRSGKRVGVCIDTGGAGPFAVYRLGEEEYYLVDGLRSGFIRNDYRVNVARETVEMMVGEAQWIRIPDSALAVVGGGSESICVRTRFEEQLCVDGDLTAVGDSLAGRRYVGLAWPRGEFEEASGGEDPYADVIERKWRAADAGGANLPFGLEERDRRCGSGRMLRITIGAEKRFGLYPCSGFETCDVYCGAPGVYRIHFSTGGGRMSESFDNEYRIDANNGKVEAVYGGRLVNVPSGTLEIVSFCSSDDSLELTATGEGGEPVVSDESVPADEDRCHYRLIGSMDPSGRFIPLPVCDR